MNFLKLATFQRVENERYETLFQRIMAHIEDNLLTVASGLQHDGEAPTMDETISPTTERLAVLMWLTMKDKRLPTYIARIYAHDLQSTTLKDIQPRIAENMDSLIEDLNASEDIKVHYSRSRYPGSRYSGQRQQGFNKNKNPTASKAKKMCILCKASGRQYLGHDSGTCWFVSKHEKHEIAKALMVDLGEECEDYEDAEAENTNSISYIGNEAENTDNTQVIEAAMATTTIRKVQSASSPYFYAFYGHTPCHIVVDTGANSSLVSLKFLRQAGINTKPTNHSARSVDKSSLNLLGEVHLTLQFGNLDLPITALVVDSLDCDFLGGVPFCRDNDIEVHLKDEELSVRKSRFSYGTRSQQIPNIFRTEPVSLRNRTNKVVMPGEFIEIQSRRLEQYEGEVTVEPTIQSLNGWPAPTISRVIQGRIRIPNLGTEPVLLSQSQPIANIRRVLNEQISCPTSPGPIHAVDKDVLVDHSTQVTVDPDGQLTPEERNEFISINKKYSEVFNPVFGTYNDKSGAIRAHVTMGPVLPPPRKGKLPLYDQSKLKLLQEEADKLESLGVLAKPEDVEVEVLHVSPSFLIEKPSGEHRFVTAFTELGQYTRITPTVSRYCDEVVRKLASFKYMIKCDLTKSFYQIKVSKKSIPYLGTPTPFKGLRVYLRSAMGQPGSSEALEELISRVFGDFIEEGWFVHIHDDINICADTIIQLVINWSRVLQRFLENNLKLSAKKTVICPKETVILGWVWRSGTITCSPHKIAPLSLAEPPKTATAMRSFLGSFKAVARCIPKYASLSSPLEDCIKGLQGSQKVTWTEDTKLAFGKIQEALKSPCSLTIPRPADQLVMTVDASPLNNGIAATLFVVRNGKRLLSGFFSMKLRTHQMNWMPCEHEALAISAGINHFSPYIRESHQKTQVLSDSKPCVQAFQKLCKGMFSASAWISTFLTALSTHRVDLKHLSGKNNTTSDFASRHPQACNNNTCQICSFAEDLAESVVNAVNITDILSGTSTMPFLNKAAWKSVQHDCDTMRRLYAHLTQGTRPTKKMKNVKDLKRFLLVASVDDQGLLVVHKTDTFVQQRSLIIVPSSILPGLITAMHMYFAHASKCQLSKVFSRYFYGINSEAVIKNVVEACETCNALRKIPQEMFSQNSTPSPTHPGTLYSADVIRRSKQKILAVVDGYSGYTTATIVPDESHKTLRSGIIINTSLFRVKPCIIRVDNAPGFAALKSDPTLESYGISLEYCRVKNINKNAVVDKCIQELQVELLKRNPVGGAVSSAELQAAVLTLNQRIRNRGLSAREILMQRDQHTGEQLNLNSEDMIEKQERKRAENHEPSARSKAKVKREPVKSKISVGDLVYLKMEGDKQKGREKYIITDIIQERAKMQKIAGKLFSSRKYEVPLTHIIPVATPYRQHDDNRLQNTAEEPNNTKLTEHTNVITKPHYFDWDNINNSNNESDSDSDDYTIITQTPYNTADNMDTDDSVELAPEAIGGEITEHGILSQAEDDQGHMADGYNENEEHGIVQQERRSSRQRTKPPWHFDYILEQYPEYD